MKPTRLWGAALCTALCALLVFTGCPTDDNNKDDDKDKKTEFEGKILKVTAIPADVTVIAAALIANLDAGNPNPEVSAFNVLDDTTRTGTFELCEATPNFVPDATKPWTGSGSYYLILAASMNQNDPQYFYTAGKEILEFNIEAFKQAVQTDIQSYITAVTSQPQQTPTGGISEIVPTQPQQNPDQEKVTAYITAKITALGNNTVTQNMTQYAFTEKTSTLAWDQFRLLDQSTIQTAATAIISAPATQTQIQEVLTELLGAMAAQLAEMQQQGG